MMKKLLFIAAIAAVTACTKVGIDEGAQTPNDGNKKSISVAVSSSQTDEQTRVAISEDTEAKTLNITFAEGDLLGAWSPSASTFAQFTMEDGSLSDDRESATFNGDINVEDDTYRLMHPYVADGEIASNVYKLDISQQTIDMGQGDDFHSLGESLPMIGPVLDATDNESAMQHIGSIICLNLRFVNTPATGELKIQSVKIEGGDNVTLYNAADLNLTASVEDDAFRSNNQEGAINATIENSPAIVPTEIYALKLAALPFTFEVDKELKITITTTSGSGTYVNELRAKNSSAAPIELKRATHLTINRECDIKQASLSYSDNWINHAAASFKSGSGTDSDPYIISTAEELALLMKESQEGYYSDYYNPTCFKLENDIDLSAYQWTRICIHTHGFKGVFDGNNKTISGLYINTTDNEKQGFFGNVYGGTIKNLTIKGKVISNKNYTGGIVGSLGSGGIIKNCTSYVDVTGMDCSGGIVGYISNDNKEAVNSCINYGTVTGRESVGGISGHLQNGSVRQSTNYGNVSGNGYYIGGVVGFSYLGDIINCGNEAESVINTANSISPYAAVGGVIGYFKTGKVINSYSRSKLISGVGGNSNGGVVGVTNSNDNSMIVNCYCVAEQLSAKMHTGGIVGIDYGSGSANYIHGCYVAIKNINSNSVNGTIVSNALSTALSKCYYDSSCNVKMPIGSLNILDGIDAEALSTADMQSSVLVDKLNNAGAEYNFYNNPSIKACAWVLVDGDYPRLDFSKDAIIDDSSTPPLLDEGNGTTDNPYIIRSAEDLKKLSSTDNIVYLSQSYKLGNDIDLKGETWTPIQPFEGVFDGANYTISGVKIAKYADTRFDLGIFKIIRNGGVVKNLKAQGEVDLTSYTEEPQTIGLIAGFVTEGSFVDNCTADVTIKTNNVQNIGAIAGFVNAASKITNCSATGTINVNDARLVGGIAGKVNDNCAIDNCHNDVAVTNTTTTNGINVEGNIGGVAGCVENSSTVINCSNSGTVHSDTKHAGGIAGRGYNNSKVLNCYNTGAVYAYQRSGGIIGCSVIATAKNCYNRGTITCDSAYSIGDEGGYPYFDLRGGIIGETYDKQYISDCYFLNSAGATKAVGMDQFNNLKDSKGWSEGCFVDIYSMNETEMTAGDNLLSKLNNTKNSIDGAKTWKAGTDGFPIFDIN